MLNTENHGTFAPINTKNSYKGSWCTLDEAAKI